MLSQNCLSPKEMSEWQKSRKRDIFLLKCVFICRRILPFENHEKHMQFLCKTFEEFISNR